MESRTRLSSDRIRDPDTDPELAGTYILLFSTTCKQTVQLPFLVIVSLTNKNMQTLVFIYKLDLFGHQVFQMRFAAKLSGVLFHKKKEWVLNDL